MRFAWWVIIAFAVGLGVVWAFGDRLGLRDGRPKGAVALPVRSGDQEIAWINTSTSASTWERFVCGLKRTAMAVPGLQVG